MNQPAIVVLAVLAVGCVESAPSTGVEVADVGPAAVSDAAAAPVTDSDAEDPVAQTARRVTELERRLGDLSQQLVGFRQEVQAEYLRVSLRTVTLNRSPAETCHEHGETCIAVRSSRTYDRRGRFWGHAVFSCSSRVIRRSHCLPGHDYHLTGPSSFHRPHDSEVPGVPSEGLCLSVPSYFGAVCAAAEAASSVSPRLAR